MQKKIYLVSISHFFHQVFLIDTRPLHVMIQVVKKFDIKSRWSTFEPCTHFNRISSENRLLSNYKAIVFLIRAGGRQNCHSAWIEM